MTAKKSLGQHFLTSDKIAHDIAQAGNVSPQDPVLEIGPGKGILTQALLETGARVTAVELDAECISLLKEKFEKEIQEGQLEIREQDILTFDPHRMPEGFRVIANIPYYITGKILRHFLTAACKPTRMVLLVQKEVAQRIIAQDGKESLLSLSVKVYGEPSIMQKVPARYFSPPPKVDSAVLCIENINNTFFSDIDEEIFFDILHHGFIHKRKKLSSNLARAGYDKDVVEVFLIQHGYTKSARAEELPPKVWKKLTVALEGDN